MAILLLAGLVMAATQATPGTTANTITAAAMLSASNAAWAPPGRGSEALAALGGAHSRRAAEIPATTLAGPIPIAAVAIPFMWQQIPGPAPLSLVRPSSVYPAE